MMLTRWLKKQQSKRQLKFITVGVTMTGLNAGVLILLVDGLSLNASVSNIGRTVLMTQVQFGIHRTYTWRDRRHEPIWPQWRRYHVQKAVSTIVGQLIFTAVAFLGAHYLVAYITSITLTGMVNFTMGDRFVFRAQTKVAQ